MKRKVLFCFLIMLLSISMSVIADSGMNYLNKSSLIKDRTIDVKELSLLIKSYDNTSDLEEKLNSYVVGNDLKDKVFTFLATSDSDLAKDIVKAQSNQGDWKEDVYLTAIISYSLLKHNLEIAAAQKGLDYIANQQDSNGSWESSEQKTSLALLALDNHNNYNQEAALNWLLNNQSGDGSWGSNINTAWALLAINQLEKNNEQIEKSQESAVNFLEKIINPDGGWGFYVGQSSNIYSTALSVWALKEYDDQLEVINKSEEFIKNLINDKAWLNKAFAYYNISEIYHLLWDHSEFKQIKRDYLSWLNDFPDQKNHDFKARESSLSVKQGDDVTEKIDELFKAQNRDYAWGFRKGDMSNLWDTTLVLRALLDDNQKNGEVYSQIIYYFDNNINSDGSFSVKSGGEGEVYLSAVIAEELSRLNKIMDLSKVISPLQSWLKEQRENDGSYGGSVLETSRVAIAIKEELSEKKIDETINYIKDQQMGDGSWGNDTLTTAAALSAIEQLSELDVPDEKAVDLKLNDIKINPQNPKEGEKFEIKTGIENIGNRDASDFEVLFTLGDPKEDDATKLDKKTISGGLSSGEKIEIDVEEKLAKGEYEIYATIDPEKRVDDNWNFDSNIDSSKVIVRESDIGEEVNLAINNIDIKPELPEPNEEITTVVDIKNFGNKAAKDFEVLFTLGNPEEGGEKLLKSSVDKLSSQETTQVELKKEFSKGEHEIHITVDAEKKVDDNWGSNNQINFKLHVIEQADKANLSVSENDIYLRPDNPAPDEEFDLTAEITNFGGKAAEDFSVEFYLGNPKDGGRLIHEFEDITLEERTKGEITWRGMALAEGVYELHVVIDSDNEIDEIEKDNNHAYREIVLEKEAVEINALILDKAVEDNYLVDLLKEESDIKITENLEEFVDEIKTGDYNFYLLNENINNRPSDSRPEHERLRKKIILRDLLKEEIQKGAGLIYFYDGEEYRTFSYHSLLSEILGIEFKELLSSKAWEINLKENNISGEGKIIKAELLDSVLGYYRGYFDHKEKEVEANKGYPDWDYFKQKHPAVTFNQFEQGKVCAFMFNPFIVEEDTDLMEEFLEEMFSELRGGMGSKKKSQKKEVDISKEINEQKEVEQDEDNGFIIVNASPEIKVEGVKDGAVYHEAIAIDILTEHSFREKEILLNGEPYLSGELITESGDYQLKVFVRDWSGKTKELVYDFTIELE